MKGTIRDLLRDYQLEDFAKGVKWRSVFLRRNLLGTDKKTCEDYFRGHAVKKLNIGCGRRLLNGWLNADFKPYSKKIICLDATKPFPFDPETFDYVYCEHMIEHISYTQGLRMLAECLRVLKPGGKIRVVTPDLYFITGLCRRDKSPLQTEYIKHATDRWMDERPPRYDAPFVVNNHFYSWGHQFLYDEETLRDSLITAGFTTITQHELNESDDQELSCLENIYRMPEALYRGESFFLEGTKPGR